MWRGEGEILGWSLGKAKEQKQKKEKTKFTKIKKMENDNNEWQKRGEGGREKQIEAYHLNNLRRRGKG